MAIVISTNIIDKVVRAALASPLSRHVWTGRGVAPSGYVKGMAVAYGNVYAKWKSGDAAALVMAQGSGNSARDALAWYGIHVGPGVDTLRKTFVLLTGLGMRESSGNPFTGRDRSAKNVAADTAEAGLFQQSWNSRTASPDLPKLFAQYMAHPDGFLPIFREGNVAHPRELENYGSGDGAAFQRLAKSCPAFAVEAAAVGLRTVRTHWGPIDRREAEMRPEADHLFQQVQTIIDAAAAAPAQEPMA